MAISFVSVSAAAEVSSGNLTLSTPADLRPDDIIIGLIAYRGTPDFSIPASGWTLIQHQPNGDDVAGGIANGIMAWSLMGLSAPNFTFTRTAGGVARGIAAVYRGVDTGTPIDVSSSATAGASSTTVTSPTITTSSTNRRILFAGCAADDGLSSAQTAATDPTSGWTERHDSLTTTGSDTAVSIADALKASAGATGQFSLTNGRSARHVGIAAALTPRATPIASFLPPMPAPRLMITR